VSAKFTGNLSPVNFRNHAREFLEAGEREAQIRSPEVSIPAYFLLGRALELALKSFLLLHGWMEADLRKVGHDLEAALREALGAGVADMVEISEEESEAIAALNIYYASKDLEYVKTGAKSYPDHQVLTRVCRRIVEGIGPAVRRWLPT
jgi:hypothetical protein